MPEGKGFEGKYLEGKRFEEKQLKKNRQTFEKNILLLQGKYAILFVLCKTDELQGLAGIVRGDLLWYHLSSIDRKLIFGYGFDPARRWAVLQRMTESAPYPGRSLFDEEGKSAVHKIEKKR